MMWKSLKHVIIICEMCWIVTQAQCDRTNDEESGPSAAQVSSSIHGCIIDFLKFL